MAADNQLLKYFDNFKGLDLRISDLKREAGSATEVLNTTVRRTGSLSKRKGYQIAVDGDKGGSGLFNFKRISFDGTTLASEDQLLTADTGLYKSLTATINIKYLGPSDREAYYTMYLNDDANFVFEIYDDNILAYQRIIGSGLEESPVNIQEIVSATNALTNFEVTLDGDGTLSAAFIPIKTTEIFPDTDGTDITLRKWEEISYPANSTAPFQAHYDTRNNEDYHPLSSVVLDDTLYLTGEGIPLKKYDGNRIYNAGLPTPTDATGSVTELTGYDPQSIVQYRIPVCRGINDAPTGYEWVYTGRGGVNSFPSNFNSFTYRLEKEGGGDPELQKPDAVLTTTDQFFGNYEYNLDNRTHIQRESNSVLTPLPVGAVGYEGGLLTQNTWKWGDFDNLGFETLYYGFGQNSTVPLSNQPNPPSEGLTDPNQPGWNSFQGYSPFLPNSSIPMGNEFPFMYLQYAGDPEYFSVDEADNTFTFAITPSSVDEELYFRPIYNTTVQSFSSNGVKPEIVTNKGVVMSEGIKGSLGINEWCWDYPFPSATYKTIIFRVTKWDSVSERATESTDIDCFQVVGYINTGATFTTSPVQVAPLQLEAVPGTLSGKYKWKFTYESYDSNGAVIESTPSSDTDTVTLSNEGRNITVSTVSSTTGYNTDQGIISQGYTGNVLPVEIGHNIKKFDVVAIKNGDFVERRVVSEVASDSITISGADVTVTEGDVISSAISIKLYRTKDEGTLFYLHSEIPNDSSVTSITIYDNKEDDDLGPFFTEQVTTREPAPVGCRYATVWRNNLLLAGRKEDPRTVYFSDVESPEYFPDVDNSFFIQTNTGSDITGIKSLDNLCYVFTEDAIAAISGDLQTTAFLVDVVSDEGVGCASHHTIQEIKGELWFLDRSGVYSISGKGLNEVSAKIESEFEIKSPYAFNRARAYNWVDDDKYMLYMPVTASNESGNVYNTSDSRIYVFDKFFASWHIWDNFDFSGGIVRFEDKIYFTGNGVDESNNVKNYMYRIHDTTTTGDYADHNEAISFVYRSHWETLGEPSVFKKYRRIKVLSLDASLQEFESEAFTLDITVENDYEKTPISELFIDFSGGLNSGWGDAEWGLFPWGEIRLFAIKRKLNQNKAKATRVSFLNDSLNENVLISGYELDVAVAYRPEIKE